MIDRMTCTAAMDRNADAGDPLAEYRNPGPPDLYAARDRLLARVVQGL